MIRRLRARSCAGTDRLLCTETCRLYTCHSFVCGCARAAGPSGSLPSTTAASNPAAGKERRAFTAISSDCATTSARTQPLPPPPAAPNTRVSFLISLISHYRRFGWGGAWLHLSPCYQIHIQEGVPATKLREGPFSAARTKREKTAPARSKGAFDPVTALLQQQQEQARLLSEGHHLCFGVRADGHDYCSGCNHDLSAAIIRLDHFQHPYATHTSLPSN